LVKQEADKAGSADSVARLPLPALLFFAPAARKAAKENACPYGIQRRQPTMFL